MWFETSKPDLKEAEKFAAAIHAKFPGKIFAYNCSPSFNWRGNLNEWEITDFQRQLGRMGYKFQFVTLSAFHALNLSMFELARSYGERGMAAYSELQEAEFGLEDKGYDAIRHQEFVGTGYFDAVAEVASGGTASTLGMHGSTERAQFGGKKKRKKGH